MRRFASRNDVKISPDVGEHESFPQKELTFSINGCAIRVHKALGPGFLESIYENALSVEFQRQGFRFERQKSAKVVYEGVEVGEHRCDFLVEGSVLVELKSADGLCDKHVAQVISTMKAFNVQVGLLFNFDETRLMDGFQRFVL